MPCPPHITHSKCVKQKNTSEETNDSPPPVKNNLLHRTGEKLKTPLGDKKGMDAAVNNVDPISINPGLLIGGVPLQEWSDSLLKSGTPLL